MSVAALLLAAQALKNRNVADTEGYRALIDQIAALADKPGRDGRDGPPGRDGVGVERATVREGRLILTRTTGDEIDVGPVTGPIGPKGDKGDPGESIIGPPGPAGRDGRDGEDGVGIRDVQRVKDNIVVVLDDGRTVDLGSFRGPAGPSGPRGPAGTGGTGGGSAITVRDEGTALTTALTSLNFTGTGVTATNSGDAVTVNIPGGASGAITSSGLTMNTARVLGRTTASSGAVEELQADDSSIILTGGNIRGRLVQRVTAMGSGIQTTTSGGSPTWAIGVLLLSVTITPKSATNNILVRATVPFAYSPTAGAFLYAALYKNGSGTDSPVKYGGCNIPASNYVVTYTVEYDAVAGSTSAQTWGIRLHANLGGTTATSAQDAQSAPTLVVEEWAP